LTCFIEAVYAFKPLERSEPRKNLAMRFQQLFAISLAAFLLLGAAASSPIASIAQQTRPLPAFPGAQGFGATTPGGRGGRVIPVTNADDSGPGSLRAAIDADGPRIVIFKVSGLITLASPITIRNPFLTIAGQTAPGDGICLRNFTLNVGTHDVVVRYLRSRLGDLSSQEADSITVLNGAHDVVIDHCSATWSIDESLSLAGDVANVTVQWCLIGEALNHSKHSKGNHGYGSLSRANGGVTWHHNLWVHNNSRNPRLGDNYGRPPFPTFDVRNNVMYDYGEICSGLTQGILKVNYVANYIRPGPASKASTPIRVGGPSELSFFIQDNFVEGNSSLTADNSQFFDPVMIDGKKQVTTVAQPYAVPRVQTSSARLAYESVLTGVGATLPKRDSVDARIISEVRLGRGAIIDSQQDVGGWPELKSVAPPVDTDGDGMPDAWERKHGLDPRNPSDGNSDKDLDGYTNLEEYLNGTDPGKWVDYRLELF
jgi:pectate lyase